MPSNALIVEVIGDTSKLTSSLKDADRQMSKFAGRSSSWDKRSGQAVADKELAGLHAQQDKLNESLSEMPAEAKKSKLALGVMGAAAVVGYQAVQKISEGLKSSGEEALTAGGKWRNAASSLMSLDVVGAALAFDVQRTTGTIEQLTKAINDETHANTINDHSITGIIDKTAALVGIDRERERQLARLTNLSTQYAAAIDDKMVGALQRLHGTPIDTGSALAFGERGGSEGRGPGAIDAANATRFGITIPVVVDGKVVAKASAKYNRRTQRVNTSPRNGPGAGGYTGSN